MAKKKLSKKEVSELLEALEGTEAILEWATGTLSEQFNETAREALNKVYKAKDILKEG